ncbi:HIT domain-containing protein [Candidatus Pacearchaeota archaeon]|nr:HIT domain-containing protein [Candidatus Pacearchaeota archaeon]
MLTQEQATQIKEQITKQIDSTFPEDKKESAKQQISTMNSEQLEEFLKQNNIIKEQQCVFCSIVSGDAQSYKIDENKNAIAILEINPISTGHILIVPKKHSQESSEQTKELTKKISNLLKEKLKPKDILVSPSTLFGHGIINIIPIYKNETIESERHKATPEELESVLKKILEEPKKPIKKPKIKKIKEKLWLPKRIP